MRFIRRLSCSTQRAGRSFWIKKSPLRTGGFLFLPATGGGGLSGHPEHIGNQQLFEAHQKLGLAIPIAVFRTA
jgi:hypothetical protein